MSEKSYQSLKSYGPSDEKWFFDS